MGKEAKLVVRVSCEQAKASSAACRNKKAFVGSFHAPGCYAVVIVFRMLLVP